MKRLVLIVDDDENARRLIVNFFATIRDWFPIVAANGKEALKAMSKQEFALVITEAHMPELSGLDLIKEIRAKYPKAPYLVVITKSCSVPPNEVLKLGADGFFRKPFTRADLLELLSALFPKKMA